MITISSVIAEFSLVIQGLAITCLLELLKLIEIAVVLIVYKCLGSDRSDHGQTLKGDKDNAKFEEELLPPLLHIADKGDFVVKYHARQRKGQTANHLVNVRSLQLEVVLLILLTVQQGGDSLV